LVLASKIINGEKRVQLIHFGALGYGHNYNKKAKENYLKIKLFIKKKMI